MQLYTVGINHTTAPIAIREKVAFDPDHLSQALLDLMGHKVNDTVKIKIPAGTLTYKVIKISRE